MKETWVALRYSTSAWRDEDKAMSMIRHVFNDPDKARTMLVGEMVSEAFYLESHKREWATNRVNALMEGARRIAADDGTDRVTIGEDSTLVFEIKKL